MNFDTELDTYSNSSGFFSQSRISFGINQDEIFYENLPLDVEKRRRIGKGANGTVYLLITKSKETNEKIVCKDIKYNAKNKISVQREIDILKKLNGQKRIIQLYGDRVLNNTAELYMPYMKEGTLADKLEHHRIIPDELCLLYSRQILEGLCTLHRHGIIHRDLKGSNILMENQFSIVVSDFGVSKFVEGKNVHTLDKGTYWWMAPEIFDSQINDGKYTVLVDLWSFGCIIIEMKTGGKRTNTLANHISKVMKEHRLDYPQGLSKILKDILDDVLVPHTQRKSAVYVLEKHFKQVAVPSEEPEWTTETESDTELDKIRCQKNPEHLRFIPSKDFNVKDIAKKFEDICENKIYKLCELLKLIISLTVKINIKKTSGERCQYWPRTNVTYPYTAMSTGNNEERNGTGIVHLALFDEEGKNYRCPKCTKPSVGGKVCGNVEIISATHLVYDQTEADQTSAKFDIEGVEMTLNRFEVINTDVERNLCVLRTRVCDRDMLYKIHWRLEKFELVRKYVHKEHSEIDYKAAPVFIVSHPHGGPKCITMGKKITKKIIHGTWSQYKYTAATCPGSSGAYVYVLGESGDLWHYPHVHTGTNDQRENYSSVGYDTSAEKYKTESLGANESLPTEKSECVTVIANDLPIRESEHITVIENSQLANVQLNQGSQTDFMSKEFSTKENQTMYFDEIFLTSGTNDISADHNIKHSWEYSPDDKFVTERKKDNKKQRNVLSGDENLKPLLTTRQRLKNRPRKRVVNDVFKEKITKKIHKSSVLKEKHQN